MLRSDGAIGVLHDGGDLAPVDTVVAGRIEIDAEPVGKHPPRRGRRLEEPFRLCLYQLVLGTGRRRAP